MDPQLYGQIIFDKAGKNLQWKKGSLFNKWCWENWTATCRTMKLDHFLTPYTKINSKWMKDLNVGKHQNPTGENRQQPLCPGNFLLDTPLEAWETKAKMSYSDFIMIKSFCTMKETVNKTKRQWVEWEKIFANDMSDAGLVSKIYRELSGLNAQNSNGPVKNGRRT